MTSSSLESAKTEGENRATDSAAPASRERVLEFMDLLGGEYHRPISRQIQRGLSISEQLTASKTKLIARKPCRSPQRETLISRVRLRPGPFAPEVRDLLLIASNGR